MEIALRKREFLEFIESMEIHIGTLKSKPQKNEMSFSKEEINAVETYFSSIKEMSSEDIKEFWAYFGEAVRFYFGGEYKLAPKSEDVAFTPIIVNYGYKRKMESQSSS